MPNLTDAVETAGALRSGLRRLLFAYLAVVVGLSVTNGGLSADALLFVLIAAVLALVISGSTVSAWLSLLAIFAAWEAMRGLAASAGHDVVVAPMIALERTLAFGVIPSVELQRLLYAPGTLGPLDVAMTAVYASLLIPPIGVAVLLWRRARSAFHRFLLALLALSLAQFTIALLVPVAPPRLAAEFGVSLPIVDIVGLAWAELGDVGTWFYTQSIGNPVAALPSLHAAYPVLAFLAARQAWPRAAWGLAAWSGIVFFAVLYLGHHYLIDVYAGVGLAVAVHLVVGRWWQQANEPAMVESGAGAESLPIPTDG
jgi:hypothetical protein